MDETVKLHIRLTSESGWPPVEFEEVEGRAVGDHECEILSPPSFAKRLAVGDVVRVAHYGSPEMPWIESLIESSDHSTVRVIFFRAAGQKGEDGLRRELDLLGVHIYETNFQGLVSLDIPPSADYGDIRAALEEGESQKSWEFEEGKISKSHSL
ncbi:DUF4265 domain-containing protein [Micromonospora tulbaghiae]|uniref:DUF4265 domain-containing protein n=1 Tax=Micromonospora tulbaghiae TaxID=479978 RepID=UPI003410A7E2